MPPLFTVMELETPSRVRFPVMGFGACPKFTCPLRPVAADCWMIKFAFSSSGVFESERKEPVT